MTDCTGHQVKKLEKVLDPGLPICDPHHHLWNFPDRRYLLKELFEDTGGGHNIVQTVFIESESAKKHDTVQRLQPVEETSFINEITAPKASQRFGTTRVAAGIVGFVDFRLGAEVVEVIEAHLAASDRFRGIRQISSWHANSGIFHSNADPGLLLNTTFREGFARLKQYKLTFETFLYHSQLHDFIDLARKFPDNPIILDHIGGPLGIGPYAAKRKEVFREWQHSMAMLAACPNVFVKLGGLGMPICGFGWSERAIQPDSAELANTMGPYYLDCIEKFGTKRCMFESNFPVDKTSYSFTAVWNAFKLICKDFTPSERTDLFYNAAAKVYRIPTIQSGA